MTIFQDTLCGWLEILHLLWVLSFHTFCTWFLLHLLVLFFLALKCCKKLQPDDSKCKRTCRQVQLFIAEISLIFGCPYYGFHLSWLFPLAFRIFSHKKVKRHWFQILSKLAENHLPITTQRYKFAVLRTCTCRWHTLLVP